MCATQSNGKMKRLFTADNHVVMFAVMTPIQQLFTSERAVTRPSPPRSRISGRKISVHLLASGVGLSSAADVTWLLSASRDLFPQYLSGTGSGRRRRAAVSGGGRRTNTMGGRRCCGRPAACALIHLALLPTARFARKCRVESQLVGADRCNGWLQAVQHGHPKSLHNERSSQLSHHATVFIFYFTISGRNTKQN